ncbi:hypothetical protein J2858_002993 [Neorhizobium galegae]|uniref:outer membrane beta-barrel protein n=1 Tax=Neorhizobium galegae TaxID=399 RepID=UPI001AEB9BB6|nr:outer membrane beta-barrel protein [Neorhizobium galegae]MBP2550060.1 hypothetical protein [Neorhizobium galegae]
MISTFLLAGLVSRHRMPATLLLATAVLAQATASSAQSPEMSGTDPQGAANSSTVPVGAVPLRGGMLQEASPEEDQADDLSQLIDGAQNPMETGIDAGEGIDRRDDGTGIRLGTFTLRPTINQSLNSETTTSGGIKSTRSYLATTANGTLTSDWARHQLTVTGEGTYERNVGGRGSTDPEGRLDADLRLDLSGNTTGHITGGYAFEREDTGDPNAVSGATTQAGVNRYSAGASLERDFGVLRGTAAIDAARTTYGTARLSDGSSLSLSDRDRTAVEGRLRLGYELSPALIPFIDARLGRAVYDATRDASGYERSSISYGGRGGLQFDFGEKLRGEFGIGYATVNYEDARLAALNAVTLDGTVFWSPHRGTDVDLGLRTTLQDATTAGASGWSEYQLSAGLTHQILNDLTGRLTASATRRDFPTAADETDWQAGAGLIWSVNRYFDVTANIGYEHTANAGGADSNLWRAGIGLSLKR